MTGPRENPTKTVLALTKEQIGRSDNDLATVHSLSSYANSIGGQLEVTGGYAVEAHFGGIISRPHADIDAILWMGSLTQEVEVQQAIRHLLLSESTAWIEYKDDHVKDHFIEFRESAEDKRFEDRRRLELYTFNNSGIRRLQKKTLVDFRGQKVEVLVSPLEVIVADKVRIMNRTQEEITRRGLRQTNQSDIKDLMRLLSHAELDQGKSIQTLAFMIRQRAEGNLTEEEAEEQAKTMWETSMQTIGYSQQGSL